MKRLCVVIVLLIALTGCGGYYGPAYYDGTVVVSDPDIYLFGGGYDRSRDVNHYSHRGSVSRGAVRSGGKHAARQTSQGNRGK